jgi:hypothetical protein
MPSFLDAAYQVLQDMDRPMSAQDITQQALEQGLLVTKGKTPTDTMAACIYRDIQKKGGGSQFILAGPNRFAINKEPNMQLELDFDIKPRVKKAIRRPPLVQADAAHQLLEHEVTTIRSFLGGLSSQTPTSEKLCDWVTMCYTFGLYSEGVDLFGFVDPSDVNEWYYTRTKKLARLCDLHRKNSSKEKV